MQHFAIHSLMILKATLPSHFLQRYHTFRSSQERVNTPNGAVHCTFKVLLIVPPLALAAVDDSELLGKNLGCMCSSLGKRRCSFGVAARWEFAVVASTVVVDVVAVPVPGEEHVVEVDSFAAVGADLGDSVPETVRRRNCCDLIAAVDKFEEVRSAVCFGCNMLRLDLP